MDCNENHEDDKDSIISDRCWEEKYRGDSRKWLTRDGSTKTTREDIGSAMKGTYKYPEKDERMFKGIRRKILEKKILEEVAQEIIDEAPKPKIEEYCTEYDGNYVYDNFDPNKKPERDTDLCLKYPLYESQAVSYWKFKFDKNVRESVSMRGLTAIRDVKNPFKRNSEFSKPISKQLDKDML